METKKIDFIIKHFGCYTPIGDKNVLTSLATMSFVPVDEFWNVFTGDAYKYFQISKTENEVTGDWYLSPLKSYCLHIKINLWRWALKK